MADIVVSPIKVRDLPAFLSAIEPIVQDLADGNILGAIAKHADNLLSAVVIATGVERAWLDDQEMDVLIDLVADIIEVNKGFFSRGLPRLTQALQNAETSFGGIHGSHTS